MDIGFGGHHPGSNAILTFGGFWKFVGPVWNLYMDETSYGDGDVYELDGGGPADPPVAETVRHLGAQLRPQPLGDQASLDDVAVHADRVDARYGDREDAPYPAI
jgi:hypothetical protein